MDERNIVVINKFLSESDNSTGYLLNNIFKRAKEGNSVELVALNYHSEFKKISLIWRIYYSIIETRELLKKLSKLKLSANSTIISGSNPFLLNLLIGFNKKKYNDAKWKPIILDFFPLNFAYLVGLKKGSYLSKLFEKFSVFFYKNADLILTTNQRIKEIFEEYSEVKVISVETWIMPDDIAYKSHEERQGPLNFQFLGNISALQNMPFVVNSFLKAEGDFIFEIFGEGTAAKKIKHMLGTSKNKVRYLGPSRYVLDNEKLTDADISVVSLLPGIEDCAVPSKAYYSILSGIPILYFGPKNSHLGKLIDKTKVGFIIDEHETNMASKKINDIVKNYKRNSLQPRKNYLQSEQFLQIEQELEYFING